MCTYNGKYRSKIENIVKANGSELHFDVTFLQQTKIASGYFYLDGGELRLSAEGSLFTSVTDMYITLHECGYGINDSNGALGTGNAANCVSGNYRIYDNIVTELKKTLFELVGGTDTSKVKNVRAPKTKEPKLSKADQRLMKPVDFGPENVWNAGYVARHQIKEGRCIELWGGNNEFYTALKTMTVYEFETTYGIRAK